MKNKCWEDFELEATEYLKKQLADYNIKVEHKGGYDSTIPDIKIIKSNKDEFFIEAKINNAQSSQFVVKIENKSFAYSSKNFYPNNTFCDQIIEKLDENFDTYSMVDQSGMVVPIPELLATKCIIENMKNKNVKYIITIDERSGKRIIPIDDFNYFFNVITKFRTKKSGSRGLSSKYLNDFQEKFKNKFPDIKSDIIQNGKKYFININKKITEKQKYIPSDCLPGISQYYLSGKGNNIYEIRITGNTDNANIIFEIKTKSGVQLDGYDIKSFIDDINKG